MLAASVQRRDAGDLLLWQRVASSSVGAVVTSLSMTPFDVVKTRLQAQARPRPPVVGRCFLYCCGFTDAQLCAAGNRHRVAMVPRFCRHHVAAATPYSGSLDAALKIVRSEGLAGLYGGLSATLLLSVPGSAIYLASLDWLKCELGYSPDNGADRWWVPPLAAAGARLLAVLSLSPLELARTNMQAHGSSWSWLAATAASEVRRAGPLSLWRGAGPSALRDVPFSALYWLTYDALKSRRLRLDGRRRLSGSEAAVFGCAAGAVAGVATLPFDVVKTQRQVEFASGRRTSPTVVAAMRELRSLLGTRALFTGIVPRLLKVIPASATMVATYEVMKNAFIENGASYC